MDLDTCRVPHRRSDDPEFAAGSQANVRKFADQLDGFATGNLDTAEFEATPVLISTLTVIGVEVKKHVRLPSWARAHESLRRGRPIGEAELSIVIVYGSVPQAARSTPATGCDTGACTFIDHRTLLHCSNGCHGGGSMLDRDAERWARLAAVARERAAEQDRHIITASDEETARAHQEQSRYLVSLAEGYDRQSSKRQDR